VFKNNVEVTKTTHLLENSTACLDVPEGATCAWGGDDAQTCTIKWPKPAIHTAPQPVPGPVSDINKPVDKPVPVPDKIILDRPVPVLDNTACMQILCEQNPPITDNGAALLNYEKSNPTSEDPEIKTCLDIIEKYRALQTSAASASKTIRLRKLDDETGTQTETVKLVVAERARISWSKDQACQFGLQNKNSASNARDSSSDVSA
jgi:hypothetical protein